MKTYHDVEKKIKHPNYVSGVDGKTTIWDYDIGLIKTKTGMQYSFEDAFRGHIPDVTTVWNHPIIMYGWGRVEDYAYSENLKQIEVKYAEDIASCNYHPALKAGRIVCFRVPNKGGRAGKGDSGSPIVLKAVNQFEKDSIGSLLTASAELLSERKNNYYFIQGPNITYFNQWIRKNAK